MTQAVKYFTIEEANQTLPLVRRIVGDIREEFPRWQELMQQYELEAANSRAQVGETPVARQLRAEIVVVAERVNGFIAELESIGCVFKGFDEGLVDFYGRREGRDVFWCWRLGEPAVTHWHELDAGYRGRQPLTPAESK